MRHVVSLRFFAAVFGLFLMTLGAAPAKPTQIEIAQSGPYVGTRVLAQWSDGYWYPGTVTGISGGQYFIAYDDGDSAALYIDRLAPIGWRYGSYVECNWLGRGIYYPGTIAGMNGDTVFIQYHDGDQENTIIGRCRSPYID